MRDAHRTVHDVDQFLVDGVGEHRFVDARRCSRCRAAAATAGRPRAGGSRSPRTAAATTAPRTPPGAGARSGRRCRAGTRAGTPSKYVGERGVVEGHALLGAVCASMRGCTRRRELVEPLLAVGVPVDRPRLEAGRRRSSDHPDPSAPLRCGECGRFLELGDHLARWDQVLVRPGGSRGAGTRPCCRTGRRRPAPAR